MSFEKMVRVTAAAASLLVGAEKLPETKGPCGHSTTEQSQELRSHINPGPELRGGVRTQETDELILNNEPEQNASPLQSSPARIPPDCPTPLSALGGSFTVARADITGTQQKQIEQEVPHIYDIPADELSVEDFDTRIPHPDAPDTFEPRSDEELTVPPPPTHQSA